MVDMLTAIKSKLAGALDWVKRVVHRLWTAWDLEHCCCCEGCTPVGCEGCCV